MKLGTPSDGRAPRLQSAVSRNLAAGSTLLGLLLAGRTAWLMGTPMTIERPLLLAVASVFPLAPSVGRVVPVLQKIVGFYLVAVLFNQIYPQYISISILPGGIAMSCSLGPLLLCAVGSIPGRVRSLGWPGIRAESGISVAWVGGLGVIAIHMAVLAMLFHGVYGYGYEDDFRVLAHLCLYYLLFLALWRQLDRRCLRWASAVTLGLFYLAIAFRN